MAAVVVAAGVAGVAGVMVVVEEECVVGVVMAEVDATEEGGVEEEGEIITITGL